MKSVRVEDHADPVLVTTNSRVLDAVLAKQEKLLAYEAGFKMPFAGRRAHFNASAFYYDYRDIQIPITGLDPVTQLNVTAFFNMPKARNLGIELETVWQPFLALALIGTVLFSLSLARFRKTIGQMA